MRVVSGESRSGRTTLVSRETIRDLIFSGARKIFKDLLVGWPWFGAPRLPVRRARGPRGFEDASRRLANPKKADGRRSCERARIALSGPAHAEEFVPATPATPAAPAVSVTVECR